MRRLFYVFTFLLISGFLITPRPASAQACNESTNCTGEGWFCSTAGGASECCKCDNGFGSVSIKGPVECCTPGTGSCRNYDVGGCNPATPTEPPPGPTSVPPPPPAVTPEFKPLTVPCDKTVPGPLLSATGGLLEFHPLRPYPANPCDPLIPKKIPEAPPTEEKLYVTFDCGLPAQPSGVLPAPRVLDISASGCFGPAFCSGLSPANCGNFSDFGCTWGNIQSWPAGTSWQTLFNYYLPYTTTSSRTSPYFLCPGSTSTICFLKRFDVNIAFDYSATDFPILGNTQNPLSDSAKVNNYLSWYLNGTLYQAEQKELRAPVSVRDLNVIYNVDLASSTDPNRIINYSGPLNKLLSYASRLDLANTLETGSPSIDYHNYQVSRYFKYGSIVNYFPEYGYDGSSVPIEYYPINNPIIPPRLKDPLDLTPLSPYYSFSSLEDTVGEVTVSIASQQPTGLDGFVYSANLYINSPSDSRLYLPHLRNTNMLSDVFASIYRPYPDGISTDDESLVSQVITEHQGPASQVPGGSDSTLVQTAREWPGDSQTVTRNTEVREGYVAPAPLFTGNPTCNRLRVRTNAGDKTYGKTINTTLTYYQFFQYIPDLIIAKDSAYCQTVNNTECKVKGSCIEQNLQCSCRCSGDTQCSGLPKGDCDSLPDNCTWQCEGGTTPSNNSGCCWGNCPEQITYPAGMCMGPAQCQGLSYGDCVASEFMDICRWETNPPVSGFECLCPGTPPYQCAACAGITDPTTCGDQSCEPVYTTPVLTQPTPYPVYCSAWPEIGLSTASRVSVFTKTPLIERIYNTLVAGKQSVLRRFLPVPTATPGPNQEYLKGEKFNQAPNDRTSPGSAPARYTVSNANDDGVTFSGSSTSRIYYPKLGSLFDYTLGGSGVYPNLQCTFRPYGYCSSQTSGPTGPCDLELITSLTSADSAGECGLCNSELGDLARGILTTAGETFNVPASAIYAFMLDEGAGWDIYDGQFTDENVLKWSTPEWCGGEPMPGCDNTDYRSQPPFGWLEKWFYAGEGDEAPWNAVQAIDPTRDSKDKISRCNFMDAAFATAKNMSLGSNRVPAAAASLDDCGGYSLNNTSRPASCGGWSDDIYIQSQVYYKGYCPGDPGTCSQYGCVTNWASNQIFNYHQYQCN